MRPAARILVVEDEPAILRGLCDLLAFRGHHPIGIAHGGEASRRLHQEPWELAIFDVMLPEVDGLTLCRQAREAFPSRAILMLTARGREEDVLAGFEAGCDDYVPKPFSISILTARVEALLRRSPAGAPQGVQLGAATLDLGTLTLAGAADEVALSPREAEVLQLLSSQRHRIVTREELLTDVWGYAQVDGVETRCVDMHMVKLRRKLTQAGVESTRIETVRGAGYRLVLT